MSKTFEKMKIPTQPDDRAATIIILDREERRVATLGGQGSPVYEPIFRDAENEAISLTFRTKSDSEEAAHLKQRNMVAVEDPWEPGVFRLLEIVEVDQVSGEGEPQLEIVCDDQALIELSGDYVDDVRLFGTTPDDALTRLLGAGESRWKVGTVNLTGDGHTNIYHESVAEGIKKLSEAWGGIFRFRVTVDGARITGRYVDWLDPSRWEDFTGVRWETGKNLKDMRKTVISSDVATAIYPYGRGEELENEDADPDADPAYGRRINIEEVEWSKENGDPVDKPKGQKWIGDPEALQRWGYRNGNGDLRHIFHVEIFEDEEDPENLAKLGWEKLQALTQEWATYEAEVVDRSRDPRYAHETTRLGTAGILIDDNFNPPVEVKARVIGAEVNLNNKRDLKITLGSFVPGVLDVVRDVQREVEKKVDRGAPITLLDTTVRNLKDRLRSSVGYKYESETLGTLWSNGPYGDPETDSYLQIKGGIMAIADRWDPVANEPDWRAFGTGAGFSADMITTGTLNAELVNIETKSEYGDLLIRMTSGQLRTYYDDKLTMAVGGYSVDIFDHGGSDPDPDYGLSGYFSMSWKSTFGDKAGEASLRGVAVSTEKDFVRLTQSKYDPSQGSHKVLKDGFAAYFTSSPYEGWPKGWAKIGLRYTFFGDGTAHIDASPNSTDTYGAVRLKSSENTFLYLGSGSDKTSTRMHVNMWVRNNDNSMGRRTVFELQAVGKGATLHVRDPETGTLKEVQLKS